VGMAGGSERQDGGEVRLRRTGREKRLVRSKKEAREKGKKKVESLGRKGLASIGSRKRDVTGHRGVMPRSRQGTRMENWSPKGKRRGERRGASGRLLLSGERGIVRRLLGLRCKR